MRPASSLFEIDQEPLFELLEVETETDGEPDWDDEFDWFPETPEPSDDLEADEPGQRSPVPSRRSRLLLALAAVGAAGVIGSRLTQDAEPPSSLPRVAPGPPAVVAAGHPSPPARQGRRARPGRTKAHRTQRRGRTRAAQTTRKTPRREPMASTPPSAVRAPAPPAPAPAPEPQGFTGEFF